MNKKRIFGIVLFILIGFFMFTFANPNEEINDEDVKPKTEEKNKKDTNEKTDLEPVAEIPAPITVVNTEANINLPTENNIPNIQPVDNTKEIEKALELENAKGKAIEELEDYKKDYNYTDSKARDEIVKEYTDAIKNAKDITDVDRLLNDAEEKIDELVKEDLTNYINAAINNIKKYALDDEKYISEIKDEKSNGIGKLETIKETDLKDIDYKNIKNEIDGIVEVTNDNIDEIIKNKTFKVTFVGKNNAKEEQIVKYKKDAKAPTTDKFINPVYKDVTYKFTKWDKEFTEIKGDLTVTAEYQIVNIKATIYLNNKEIPNPKTKTVTGAYTKLGTVNLKLDSEKINNSILKDKNANIYTNDDFDITTLFNGNPNIPALENKYDYYEFYVVKFVSGSQAGIHIDCVKKHDSAQEELDKLNDAKERLNDLINSLPKNCNETYTSTTCSALDEAVNNSKNASTLTEIENAINEITNAKNNLVEIVLDHITLTLNSDTYYLNGEAATLKVEAFYNDKDGEINNYKVVTAFDNTSVGSREVKVSYTFNGVTKEASATYKVIYTNEQLSNMFKNTTAELYLSGTKIVFSNLPIGAKVTSIRRADYNSSVKFNSTNDYRTYIFDSYWNDYRPIRHNWGHSIYITYMINNQTYTKKYDESFGEID